MSFNNAWNHVRLSLDQQGMSLRAVSLVNCRNELELFSNPLISLVRGQCQCFFLQEELDRCKLIISLR